MRNTSVLCVPEADEEAETEEEDEDFLLPKTLTCCPGTNLSTENPLIAPSSKASIVQATMESSKKVNSSAFKKLDPWSLTLPRWCSPSSAHRLTDSSHVILIFPMRRISLKAEEAEGPDPKSSDDGSNPRNRPPPPPLLT